MHSVQPSQLGAWGLRVACDSGSECSSAPTLLCCQAVCPLLSPCRSSLVGELHYLAQSHRLAALLDPLSLLRSGAQQASQLSVLDAATWAEAGPPMRDVLDGYELVAAVPAGSPGGGGCEFIAGSVKLSSEQGWVACQWREERHPSF